MFLFRLKIGKYMLFKQNNTERKTKYFVILLAIIIKILKYIYYLYCLLMTNLKIINSQNILTQ